MFNRPSLTDIVNRTRADILSRMTQDELLRFADAEILARVLAGASHELHGYLDYISRQILCDTAEAEYLDRWASLFGLQRKAAEAASGSVTLQGTVGSVLLDGVIIRHIDGREYAISGEQTLSASPQDVLVEAVIANAAGNLIAGSPLAFLSPVVGVQSGAVVAAGGIVNGSDIEGDTDLRARLLARIRQPPHGGSKQDYVAWALEVPGVTRAWCTPVEAGPGTVTVRFVRDGDASIIPDAAEVLAVYDHIETRRPVTAEVFVIAPTPIEVDFSIIVTPDTAAIRAAISAELSDMIKRTAAPGGRIYLSHIREAISIAAGETDHVLVAPVADIVPAAGEVAVMGAITWL